VSAHHYILTVLHTVDGTSSQFHSREGLHHQERDEGPQARYQEILDALCQELSTTPQRLAILFYRCVPQKTDIEIKVEVPFDEAMAGLLNRAQDDAVIITRRLDRHGASSYRLEGTQDARIVWNGPSAQWVAQAPGACPTCHDSMIDPNAGVYPCPDCRLSGSGGAP
jgi:hypothetical protein